MFKGQQRDLYDWQPDYLKLVMFVCMCCQEVFGALHVIGKFGFCQVCSKSLKHLGCGLHCHSKVFDGLDNTKHSMLCKLGQKQKAYRERYDWMTVNDSLCGGGSIDCDSTAGFHLIHMSAGLYPHSHADLTGNSAWRPKRPAEQAQWCRRNADLNTWFVTRIRVCSCETNSTYTRSGWYHSWLILWWITSESSIMFYYSKWFHVPWYYKPMSKKLGRWVKHK